MLPAQIIHGAGVPIPEPGGHGPREQSPEAQEYPLKLLEHAQSGRSLAQRLLPLKLLLSSLN